MNFGEHAVRRIAFGLHDAVERDLPRRLHELPGPQ